ncbi:hypothetical protein SAMN05444266_10188 [Chitinophaga jiangningensis]|uniref:Tetratricopeptide repeat-containing protein n=2 Tax=Chitinophaga jiangningensis TaxID=1419482 RepID=A0A1M6V6Z5_9BACT|nr:hypothetical protein SAMN05444266_10188 [Chitinophaga jiangningensis]
MPKPMFPFSFWSDYYFLFIILQLACVYHAYRHNNREGIYLTLFLPVIGSLIYFFQEILPDITSGNLVQNLQLALWPDGRVKEWEKRVQAAGTITNKMELAAAYGQRKAYDKAIQLTQECAQSYAADQGIFLQLARLQFMNNQFAESLATFDKVNSFKGVRMVNTSDELMYAQALEATANTTKAEEAYQKIIQVHHSLEAMYYYGLLLKKQGRTQEAREQFERTKAEIGLHPRYVRRTIRKWVWLSRKELATLK